MPRFYFSTSLAFSTHESKKALAICLADTVKSGDVGQMEYWVRKGGNSSELSLSLAKHLYPKEAKAYERAKNRLAETVTGSGINANTVKSLVEKGLILRIFVSI